MPRPIKNTPIVIGAPTDLSPQFLGCEVIVKHRGGRVGTTGILDSYTLASASDGDYITLRAGSDRYRLVDYEVAVFPGTRRDDMETGAAASPEDIGETLVGALEHTAPDTDLRVHALIAATKIAKNDLDAFEAAFESAYAFLTVDLEHPAPPSDREVWDRIAGDLASVYGPARDSMMPHIHTEAAVFEHVARGIVKHLGSGQIPDAEIADEEPTSSTHLDRVIRSLHGATLSRRERDRIVAAVEARTTLDDEIVDPLIGERLTSANVAPDLRGRTIAIDDGLGHGLGQGALAGYRVAEDGTFYITLSGWVGKFSNHAPRTGYPEVNATANKAMIL